MRKTVFLLCALVGAPSCFAGAIVPTVTSKTQTRVYAGLVWTLSNRDSLKPDVAVGAQSLIVKSNNQVSGADFSVRFKIDDGLRLDSSRLSYVGGERNMQGQVGFGYSHINNGWLGTAAASGPYSRIGVDYLFGKGDFAPSLELNTMPRPN